MYPQFGTDSVTLPHMVLGFSTTNYSVYSYCFKLVSVSVLQQFVLRCTVPVVTFVLSSRVRSTSNARFPFFPLCVHVVILLKFMSSRYLFYSVTLPGSPLLHLFPSPPIDNPTKYPSPINSSTANSFRDQVLPQSVINLLLMRQ